MNKTKKILIFICFFILIAIVYTASINFFERKTQDIALQYQAQKNSNPNVVLVVIDEKSNNRIRWPWKRELYAEIFRYLHDYAGAKVIVFDFFLASPDTDYPESDKKFYETVKKYDNFISAIGATNKTDSGTIFTDEEIKLVKSKIKVHIHPKTDKYKDFANGIIRLAPGYINYIQNLGSAEVPVETDEIIRAVMPFTPLKGDLYPLLGFYAYALYTGQSEFYVDDKYLCSADECKTLKINMNYDNKMPKMYLKWYKKLDSFSTHKSYSAIDVLDSLRLVENGKKPVIPEDTFKDKIVFIGGNAANVKSIEDLKQTSMLPTHAGVDIQATAAGNFLDNISLKVPSFTQNLLITSGVVALSIMAISLFSAAASVAAIIIIFALYTLLFFLLLQNNILIPILTPFVLEILVLALGYSYRFLAEGTKKEQIQNAMGMYLSQDIMKDVVKNIDNLKLGGKRADITVLFADIRGFTTLSEKMSAEEVSEILNEYFAIVEPIISKHKGVINKFIGDAVLAIFGEPIQDKNHALNAVLCANEIHENIVQLQSKLEAMDKPMIEIGIGINTGEAFVGNIGTSKRLEYTVIGDTVNTASRIESYNKVYKTKFLISECTYSHVSSICDVIKIKDVEIRGKSQRINIYEVIKVSDKPKKS